MAAALVLGIWEAAVAAEKPVDMHNRVILTEKDDNQAVTVHVGQSVIVDLPENASTGYRWEVETVDPAIIEAHEGKARYPAGAVGSAGRVEWVFVPKAPGLTSLTLKNWRSWDDDAPVAARFHAQLSVIP